MLGGYTRSQTIPPAQFICEDGTNIEILVSNLKNIDAGFVSRNYYAPIHLPHGCQIERIVLFGYREDALSAITLELYNKMLDTPFTTTEMASCSLTNTDGYGSAQDNSITDDIVSNSNKTYTLKLAIDNNDNIGDCWLSGVLLDYKTPELSKW